jgi:hypothetical protein
MTNDTAVQLEYDVGFGPGTLPSHVASFIVTKILEREGRTQAKGARPKA